MVDVIAKKVAAEEMARFLRRDRILFICAISGFVALCLPIGIWWNAPWAVGLSIVFGYHLVIDAKYSQYIKETYFSPVVPVQKETFKND